MAASSTSWWKQGTALEEKKKISPHGFRLKTFNRGQVKWL